ncbi:MAG: hypothetical protein RDU59_07075 [Thermodesulfobacteriota bacterium]|jgi:hypothetical protein|nr:hypothetical protein [Thermodesulfobacteriota bacterium]
MKTFKYIFFGSIALSCLLGLVFTNPHPHFWWQKIPVFDAVFGFIGCIVIIVVSKALGHGWLQKKEGYYD